MTAIPSAADAETRQATPQTTPQTTGRDAAADYLETLALVERLHRLLLDMVRSEFERSARFEISAIQALLLFHIGPDTYAAGELRARGLYQGTNVSYTLRKLVEAGYIDYQRSDVDRRSVRVRLTPRGLEVHRFVAGLFERQARDLEGLDRPGRGPSRLDGLNANLRWLERYWSQTMRCPC